MKNLILIAVFLVTAWAGQAVYAQQGFGTNTPDKSAAVDIVSTKRGLLVPRIALTALDNASPVSAPANSLFVYNTATAGTAPNNVTPGYYYWDAADAKWIRFISSADMKTSVVAAGENVKVDADTVGNEITYTVGVQGGDTDGKVLVTKVDNTDPGNPVTTTEWVDPAEFVNDAIVIGNGLTKNAADSNRVELGGVLTRDTTALVTDGALKTLAIQGLEDVTLTFQDDADGFVMVLTTDGVLQMTKLSSLVKANNGLTVNDGTDNPDDAGKVQLGGDLTQATTIATGVSAADAANQNAANTLAITGLTAATAANNIVVADTTSGVLRTVKRSISAAIPSTSNTVTIGTSLSTDYSPYVQEVNVAVALGNSDTNLTLPDATASEGQVINIKITNEDEVHDGYLNIISGSTTLTYGALPYQGWVLKSNGTDWLIVGRN